MESKTIGDTAWVGLQTALFGGFSSAEVASWTTEVKDSEVLSTHEVKTK